MELLQAGCVQKPNCLMTFVVKLNRLGKVHEENNFRLVYDMPEYRLRFILLPVEANISSLIPIPNA